MDQMVAQWADNAEETQALHLRDTKQQMEYVQINKEYDFIKKRALTNYMTRSRTELEHHFHGRAKSMLDTIEHYERTNLRKLIDGIGKAALAKVHAAMADPEQAAAIKQGAFESALSGIRDGTMTYKNDPILPIL